MNLRLLSYNIRYGGSGREKYLAAVIAKTAPDIVVFQEATKPHVIERLAAETGLTTWAARPGYSLAFISRLDIAHYEWHHPRATRRSFLEIQPAGTEFRIFGLHFSAVHANWRERRRVREMRTLLTSIERHQEGFHVLVGDFNTLAPGELLDHRQLPLRLLPFIWLSGGRIRWEAIQTLLDARYVDGYRIRQPIQSIDQALDQALDQAIDKGFTFPTWNPHVRLDYIFLPAAFTDRLKACEIVKDNPAAQASDHFPLLAQLEIP